MQPGARPPSTTTPAPRSSITSSRARGRCGSATSRGRSGRRLRRDRAGNEAQVVEPGDRAARAAVLLCAAVLARRHRYDRRVAAAEASARVERTPAGRRRVAGGPGRVARYTSGFSRVLAFILAAVALAGAPGSCRFATEQVGHPFRPRDHRTPAGDARQPARVLRRHLRAQRRRDGGRGDRDPRLDPRQRPARARAGDRRRRAARTDGMMRFARGSQRHRDAIDDRQLHHRCWSGWPTRAHDPASHHIKTISIISAMAILAVYCSGFAST